MENQGGSLIGLETAPAASMATTAKRWSAWPLMWTVWLRPWLYDHQQQPIDALWLNESWPQTLTLVWNVAPRYASLQPQPGG